MSLVNTYQDKKAALFDSKDPAVFVIAHRGGYKKDFEIKCPENSVANLEKAIRLHYDMVEMDVCRSKDGVYVLMHDSKLWTRTTGEGHTFERTWEEMSGYKLLYNNKQVSDVCMTRFEEVAKVFKDKLLIKLHRKFDLEFLPEFLELVNELSVMDQLLFWEHWDPSDSEFEERINVFSKNPICKECNLLVSIKDTQDLKDALKIGKVRVIELHFDSIQDELVSCEFIESVKKLGLRLSVNTQKIASRKDKVGGLTDLIALEDPDQSWGKILSMGITLFQTDYPEEMRAYFNQKLS